MIGAFFLAAVQLTVTPANPTVGDPVTLTLVDGGGIAAVSEDGCAEVVETRPAAVVVRSFAVGECAVRFTLTGEPDVTHEAVFTVRSVLTEEDPAPSPYRPPTEIPIDRRAWWSIGIAGIVAAAAWALVFVRKGAVARPLPSVPALPPLDELLSAVGMIGERSNPEEQIVVADAVRRYLDRTDRRLTTDRTTGEVLRWLTRRRDPRVDPLRAILLAGDRAKFAPDDERSGEVSLSESLQAFIDLEIDRRDRVAG